MTLTATEPRRAPHAPADAVLEVRGLSVAYAARDRAGEPVLNDVSLDARAGEILGVIGETGSGKTTLARAVVGLAPVRSGLITVDGTPVTGLRGKALRAHRRGGRVQYMFQDPLRSLDPDLTVGEIIAEPLTVGGLTDRAERDSRVAEALESVGLSAEFTTRTPGRLSGGQRQRVSLARAVVTRPRLLIADEPVSALDASNRNHVLLLLDELRRTLGLALVVISHDLASLAGIADRIAVLYRGRVVEYGPSEQVLGAPLHPYTALLTASAPSVRPRTGHRAALLRPTGTRPAWTGEPPQGACVFTQRCRFASDACRTHPATREHGADHGAACHHSDTWPATLATAAD
ncbi:ABC transporter ATP-binding protein [Yinghuangia sp. ASG 101]|uniref:ABC transporter ATP-binding protein n=1 Tax=Yinghuangia sp. ASG 101 TaxID=2896848 RepID=UPI001E465174|nr:ABC transporter ATP-binding protein [Yinghuangia sp. ASG 101]UGQ12131.1 ABC transporter ATP-binding protein [Yinghuangia sp. ASG 101]